MENALFDKRKILTLLATIVLITLIGSAFAWFTTAAEKDIAKIAGNTKYIQTYFAGGDGTVNNPYIISKPEHLNNLAWLQYLGYFNKETSGTITTTYFKLDPVNALGASTNTLNMTGWTLPPIGTERYPFVGNFDGNGKIISNLTVKNSTAKTDYTNPPVDIKDAQGVTYAGRIVGLFGVIGKYTDNISYSSSANQIKNFYLENSVIHAKTTAALAGLAAGYVNGTIDDIGVVNSNIQNNAATSAVSSSYTNNLSDYSLVGYCTDNYLDSSDKETVKIHKPTRTEEVSPMPTPGGEWGNTIDMKKLENRLANMDNNLPYFQYSINQTIIKNKDGTITVEEGQKTETNNKIRHYYKDNYNSVAFTTGGVISALGYQTLYGAKNIPVDKTITTKRKVQSASFQISQGTIYLHTDGTSVIAKNIANAPVRASSLNAASSEASDEKAESSENEGENSNEDKDELSTQSEELEEPVKDDKADDSENDEDVIENVELEFKLSAAADSGTAGACYWEFSDNTTHSGYLLTKINGTNYYLNRNGTNLVVSTTPSTTWYTADNQLMTTVGTDTYYLVYSSTSNTWKLSQKTTTKYIINDGDHYLKVNPADTSAISDTIVRDEATGWTATWNNAKTACTFTTTIGGKTYYLSSQNGDLTTYSGSRTSYQTQWYINTTQNTISDGTYCIRYQDGAWDLYKPITKCKIAHKDGNNAIGFNTGSKSLMNTTKANAAELYWTSGNKIYTVYNGTKYYLRKSGSSLTFDTRDSDTWHKLTHGWYTDYSRIANNSTVGYLIRYNGSWNMGGTTVGSATALNIIFLGYDQVPTCSLQTDDVLSVGQIHIYEELDPSSEYDEITTVTEPGFYTTPETYVPIDTDGVNSFAPSEMNTGYIISGGSSDTRNNFTNAGDIRVCSNGYVYRELSYSNNGTTSYSDSNAKYLQVLTRTANSNGYVRIKDSFNENNINDVSSTLSAHDVKTVDELGLKKYNAARTKYGEILKSSDKTIDSQNMYGIHFMNADIGMDNLATLSYAYINDTEDKSYTNYQMPRNCIDFKVNSLGSINFFAGSYFRDASTMVSNDCFFSLYRVERNAYHKITAIKKISQVYEMSNKDIRFKYSDGSSSGSLTGGTLVFDMSWIENPGSNLHFEAGVTYNSGALYYFEIPACAGEYALGSVSGKNAGAYLTYLDISASTQNQKTTTEVETIETNREEYKYPKGIDFKASTSSSLTDTTNTASIQLATGGVNTSNINFNRAGDTITVSTRPNQKCSYKANDGITVKSPTANLPLIDGSKIKDIVKQITTVHVVNSTTGAEISNDVTTLKDEKTNYNSATGTWGTITKTKSVNGGTETSDTHDTISTSSDVVLQYRYFLSHGGTVTTTMTRELSGLTKDNNVKGTYHITLTPSENLKVLIETVASTFNINSTLNGTTMVENNVQTINR